MRIVIETVEHKDQRYDTVGDWRYLDPSTPTVQVHGETLIISVSRMKDWRSEALVAVHELIEALLCKHAGITAEQVDEFDMSWEAKQFDDVLHEPGDDPDAPYHLQHMTAMAFEKWMASELKLPWLEHEANVDGASE